MSGNQLEKIKNYLGKNVGDMGLKLLEKSTSKIKISENPSNEEIGTLLADLEKKFSLLYGNDKAKGICDDVRKHLVEKSDIPISKNIDNEINNFLLKNALPTERDITDYSKYLVMKFGGNAQQVEKELIEKVRVHIKTRINRKKVNEEIMNFLVRYKDPAKSDIDDFVHYISLSKLEYPENELREQIEKDRLFLKFHGPQEGEESELDKFVDLVRYSNDKDTVNSEIKKQGLSYLVKDESGVSDKALSEFIEFVTPKEEDMKATLEGLNLGHMVKKK